MDNYYIQGFVDKCAAHGIDPEQLIKYAEGGAYAAKPVLPAAPSKSAKKPKLPPKAPAKNPAPAALPITSPGFQSAIGK
jgi:hypothetical protein